MEPETPAPQLPIHFPSLLKEAPDVIVASLTDEDVQAAYANKAGMFVEGVSSVVNTFNENGWSVFAAQLLKNKGVQTAFEEADEREAFTALVGNTVETSNKNGIAYFGTQLQQNSGVQALLAKAEALTESAFATSGATESADTPRAAHYEPVL